MVKDDKEIEFEICAFDGRHFPVKGHMNVTIGYKPIQFEQGNAVSVNLPSYKFNQTIDGCAVTKVDAEKVQLRQQFNYMLVVQVKVVQDHSLIHQHLIQELTITGNKLMFTLPSLRMGKSYFKPQIPFKGYVSLKLQSLRKFVRVSVINSHP